MPFSVGVGKADFLKEFNKEYKTGMKVIDVGAGAGTYRDLCGVPMDAVEIHKPYIDKYNLTAKYSHVYNQDAKEVDYTQYDIAILGDVLEHMSVEDAQVIITKLCESVDHVFIVVPYMWPQGIYDNNEHEIHLQDDLNDKTMTERYPQLKKVSEVPIKGKAIAFWRN